MLKEQTGFILLGASANLLVITMLIMMVLGYFINSIAIQNRIREQERADFLGDNYLVTGSSEDTIFFLEESKQNLDAWLLKKEIKIYRNDKLVVTKVILESNDKIFYD